MDEQNSLGMWTAIILDLVAMAGTMRDLMEKSSGILSSDTGFPHLLRRGQDGYGGGEEDETIDTAGRTSHVRC